MIDRSAWTCGRKDGKERLGCTIKMVKPIEHDCDEKGDERKFGNGWKQAKTQFKKHGMTYRNVVIVSLNKT